MYSRISWHKHVSCAFSRLPFSLLNERVAKPPCGRTHAPPTHYLLPSPFSLLWLPTARCRRTTFSFLLPTPYFGSPLQSVHALPSPFFSLLPTLEAHCIVTTHYLLLSSPFSLLSCPLVSISGSIIIPFVYFVFFVVPPLPPPTQWTRGGTAVQARPSATSKHYPLPSSPFSLLWKPTA